MPLEVQKSGSEQAQSNLFPRRWLSGKLSNEAGTKEGAIPSDHRFQVKE